MSSWNNKTDFKKLLHGDKEIKKFLSIEEIDSLFDLDKIMININKIYKRIGLD